MKKTILILSLFISGIAAKAQTDSVIVNRDNDTIRIGGIVILKNGSEEKKRVVVTVGNDKQKKKSKLSTSTAVIDIGFSNWTDKTNYAAANNNQVLINPAGGPELGASDFKIKTGKSVNVNIWFVMQRLSLINNYVNLKYGLGLELNNYRFTNQISFNEGGPNPFTGNNISHAFVFRDSIKFSKNKLAADYVTVPLMLNFNTNPNDSKKGLDISAGVSMGFLYSSRNKQISSDRGKEKNRGDYDLEKWKFSYIGEIGMGPIRLYGSYSPNSIFSNDLNFTPYNLGIRLGNW